MALRIPEQFVDHVKALVHLDSSNLQRLAEAFGTAAPTMRPEQLIYRVAARANEDRKLVTQLFELSANLYYVRLQGGQSPSEFTDAFMSALDEHQAIEKDILRKNENAVRSFVEQVVQLDKVIGVTSKALDVLVQAANPVALCRIVTDFRPVYSPKTPDEISSGFILHTLKISAYDSVDRESDHYFSLDSSDLRQLKEAVERALLKESTLRAVVHEADIDCLDRDETLGVEPSVEDGGRDA